MLGSISIFLFSTLRYFEQLILMRYPLTVVDILNFHYLFDLIRSSRTFSELKDCLTRLSIFKKDKHFYFLWVSDEKGSLKPFFDYDIEISEAILFYLQQKEYIFYLLIFSMSV